MGRWMIRSWQTSGQIHRCLGLQLPASLIRAASRESQIQTPKTTSDVHTWMHACIHTYVSMPHRSNLEVSDFEGYGFRAFSPDSLDIFRDCINCIKGGKRLLAS